MRFDTCACCFPAPAGCMSLASVLAVYLLLLQLNEFDERTGVISSATETTAVIAQKAVGMMSKAAEDRRVQGVVTNVSTGW